MLLRRIIDISMTISLMLLMSFQVTGQALHEWIGAFMLILVLIHNYLNRRWYGTIFKGKYNLLRFCRTLIILALLISFILTGVSGFIMSDEFEFLNIRSLVWSARLIHLSSSYWSFVLMGVHLGFHWAVFVKFFPKYLKYPAVIFSLYGLYLNIKSGVFDYMFLVNQFTFFDYDKSWYAAIFENILMLGFWTFTGYYLSKIILNYISRRVRKN